MLRGCQGRQLGAGELKPWNLSMKASRHSKSQDMRLRAGSSSSYSVSGSTPARPGQGVLGNPLGCLVGSS